jgi:SOS-response transcriptional repressor LexA
MRKPTRRQLAVLRAIHNLSLRNGIIPTLREIGREVGIRSPHGVADHLHRLEAKRLILRGFRKSRTISLTAAGFASINETPQRLVGSCSRASLTPTVRPNTGETCGWCGAHYFGRKCPFLDRHDEAAGW